MEPQPAHLMVRAFRHGAEALVLACVWILLFVVAEPLSPGVASARAADSEPCADRLSQTIFPQEVLLGDTVDIELRIDELCLGGAEQPLNIVLVFDTSGSMTGEPIARASSAAYKFVRDMMVNPLVQIGVVSSNQEARILCWLQTNRASVQTCVGNLAAMTFGFTDLASGLVEAGKVLKNGRVGHDVEPYQAVILLSDGANAAGCNPVEGAANELKNESVAIGTVCIGPHCDQSCLRKVATDSGMAQEVTEPDQVGSAFNHLGREITDVKLRQLNVNQMLQPDLEFVRADARSPDAQRPVVDENGITTIRWQLNVLPPGGLTLGFTVRPKAVGELPSGKRAWLVARDNRDTRGSGSTKEFPQGSIRVYQPPVASPVPPATPTATLEVVPSATSATIATPHPVASADPVVQPPVRARHRAFMPRLQRAASDIYQAPLLGPFARPPRRLP